MLRQAQLRDNGGTSDEQTEALAVERPGSTGDSVERWCGLTGATLPRQIPEALLKWALLSKVLPERAWEPVHVHLGPAKTGVWFFQSQQEKGFGVEFGCNPPLTKRNQVQRSEEPP